jgi:hypothetical protein
MNRRTFAQSLAVGLPIIYPITIGLLMKIELSS